MSKTIEEIKDEVAIEYGWKSWKSCYGEGGITNTMIDEVTQRYAQSQTQELTAWKESASKVFKNLDLQAIGKTLGIGLGEDVSINVLPKIKELQEQNSELVEVLKHWFLEYGYGADRFYRQELVDMTESLLTKYNHLKSNTNG